MRRIVAMLISVLLVLGGAPGIVFAAGTTTAAKKAAPAKAPHYDRLFYYTDNANAKADFFAHYKSIDTFAPQVYGVNKDGVVLGTLSQDLIAFAQKHKIKIMPVVTNSGFSEIAYENILSDATRQNLIIDTLVAQAQLGGYVGYQFDFEQIDAGYRDRYSAFIKKAADTFHAYHLILSVAVVSKISDNASDYKKDLYQNLIGAYDYVALGSSADFVTVMSYDDPDSTGPIAPLPWMKKVLAYTLKNIPAQKISLGIPLYYWLWNEDTEKLIEIGGKKGIDHAFATHNLTTHYSTNSQAPYAEWKKAGVHYILWYENAKSIAAKVALMKKYKLYGDSFWALGLGIPSVYGSI